MDEIGKGVTVTVTPGGQVCGITLDGVDIARHVRAGDVSLFCGSVGSVPMLQLAIEPDRIIVKAAEE